MNGIVHVSYLLQLNLINYHNVRLIANYCFIVKFYSKLFLNFELCFVSLYTKCDDSCITISIVIVAIIIPVIRKSK